MNAIPPGDAQARPTVSVVVAAFANERWPGLLEAVSSIANQTYPALETIAVIDHNDALFDKATAELRDVQVYRNVQARGASGARNTGVAGSTGELVAFLDDDAVADPHWLGCLIAPFRDPEVIGVGGWVTPTWSSRRPAWFPQEFDWVIGASFRGMPEQVVATRNVWSENMAIRREVFDAIGGFRPGYGKTGSRSRPEDTDLCLRAAAARAGTVWMFQPDALAHHKVPESRERLSFFIRRCFAEGQGKAELAALLGGKQALASERTYTRNVLPRGVLRGLRETLHGDPTGLARAVMIIVGLGAAAGGLVQGRWSLRR